jgi:MFS family permease
VTALAAARPGAMTAGDFNLLSLSYCLGSAQFWMTVPLVAIALASHGVPAWQIGVLGAVPWLVLVAALPLAPAAAAALGAMRAYRLGLWFGLAGAVVFAGAGSPTWWACGYALCGLSLALKWVVADSLVATLAPPGRRGHRVGLFETLCGGSMAVGPAALIVVGAEGVAPYLVGVALAALALVPTPWLKLEAPLPRVSASLRGLGGIVARRPAAMLTAAASGVMEGAATKLLPVQALGLGFDAPLAAATVTAFAAGNLLTQYAVG